MSENSMGNVDNRANVGNQTIINIQNMSGSIALPNGQSSGHSGAQSFDEHMIKLYASAQALSNSLNSKSSSDKEKKVKDFNKALAQVVNLASGLSDPVNEIATLVELATEWEKNITQSSTAIESSGDDLGLIFLKITQLVKSYVTAHSLVSACKECFEISDAFISYLDAAYSWYKKLRTLLYDKVPHEFYSFYVCNDLKYGDKTIGGITAGRLCKLSNFSIISGTGGLGKSMMMRHLFFNAIENYDRLKILPIFITLKDYGELGGSLYDYILSAVRRFDANITRDQFMSALKSGSCLLLFDGMDEVKSTVSSQFAHELDNLASGYPQNYYVISSRPSAQLISLNNFCELELQPFSKMQALKMIDNFEFSIDEQKIKENFRTRLDGDLWWSHKEFAENPLLLTIMLMTFEEYAEVPSKIHKFYEMAFETLARKHDESKLLNREFKSGMSKDVIADYLAKVCFLSYKDERYELTESEFKHYFDRCQKNISPKISADDFLYNLSNNLCLLLPEGGKYHFVHRSFQEYFCARNIKSGFEKVSTDKKESMSAGLIEFFDRPRDSFSDSVLEMLYDMIPEKIEEFILIPKLEHIFNDNDLNNNDGYWRILERAFPNFRCWYEYHECIERDSETDEVFDESYYDFAIDTHGHIESKVLQFIMFELLNIGEDDGFDGTYYDNEEIMKKVPIIVEEFKHVKANETEMCKHINEPESDYIVIEYSTFYEIIKKHWLTSCGERGNSGEHEYWVSLDAIRKNSEKHTALLSVMGSEDFHFRKVCLALQKYLYDLKSKQKATDDEWTEDFI